MRKITEKSVNAFYVGENFKSGNMKVIANGDTAQMFLHDNLIAVRCGNELKITNAGWKTRTTKDRLNGLDGVSIQQKNGEWFLNDQEWDGSFVAIK